MHAQEGFSHCKHHECAAVRRCSNGDSGTSAVRPSMMDIEPANRSATGSSLPFVHSVSLSTPSLADVSRAVEQIPSPYDSSWRGLRMHEAMTGDDKAHTSTHTSRQTETIADSARRAQLLGEAGKQVHPLFFAGLLNHCLSVFIHVAYVTEHSDWMHLRPFKCAYYHICMLLYIFLQPAPFMLSRGCICNLYLKQKVKYLCR